MTPSSMLPSSDGSETSPRVDHLLAEARRLLAAGPFDISPREAALLLGHVLSWSEAQVRARNDHLVGDAAAQRYRRWVARRAAGEPVAYLVNTREFYGRPFYVDDRVLIPRPETEHLVEIVLELDLPTAPRVLDVGSGSGCLAVTLAAELPEARVTAVDVSAAALAVTARNARRHGVASRLKTVGSDLASAVRLDAFHLVVSNPPYVGRHDMAIMSAEVTAHEPHLALFAPDHGRALIEDLLDAAVRLRPGVHLLLEIGYDQGDWLHRAAARRPHLELLEIRPDLSGIPRSGVLRRRRGD